MSGKRKSGPNERKKSIKTQISDINKKAEDIKKEHVFVELYKNAVLGESAEFKRERNTKILAAAATVGEKEDVREWVKSYFKREILKFETLRSFVNTSHAIAKDVSQEKLVSVREKVKELNQMRDSYLDWKHRKQNCIKTRNESNELFKSLSTDLAEITNQLGSFAEILAEDKETETETEEEKKKTFEVNLIKAYQIVHKVMEKSAEEKIVSASKEKGPSTKLLVDYDNIDLPTDFMYDEVTIRTINATHIFDSRGFPMVEVVVGLSDGRKVRASVPSGESTGIYGESLDYLGEGVLKAVERVNSIIGPALIGKNPIWQTAIDNVMVEERDGSKNKGGWCKQELGANAILAVSIAVCKAGALVQDIPTYKHISNLAGNKNLVLPVPAFSVINGGSRSGKKRAIQELTILPVGGSTFKEAMGMGVEVYHTLKNLIRKKYGQDATYVGDEGAFSPNIQDNNEGLELLKTAIAEAKYTGKVIIGMDVAASDFYDLNFKEKDYHIVCKDLFDQNDWEQIVGDDFLTNNPNPKNVAKAMGEKSCLLKVNQIGSLTTIIELVSRSKQSGWNVMASHSGDSEDTFIADLSIGLATGLIRAGGPKSLAKYNQILRIEEKIGDEAVYAGARFRAQ